MMNEFLTAEMLQLPQEVFDAVKNVVIHTKSTGGYAVKPRYERVSAAEWSKRQTAYKQALTLARLSGQPISSVPRPSAYEWINYWTPTRKNERFGMLLLNWIHDIVHSFGYEYKGNIDGKFIFEKVTENWLDANGKTYPLHISNYAVYPTAGGAWMIEDFDNQNEQEYEVLGVWTIFDRETIAKQAKVAIESVNENERDMWIGQERDPSVYLTSMFPRWSTDGSEFATYINGKRHDLIDIKTLINEAGQKWNDYDINMAALNDCAIPAVHLDADSTGNSGECADVWYENELDAKMFNFDYDLTKQFAVKSFSIEISAANGTPNGHYPRYTAYFDVKNGVVVQ